jgi:UDP-galactopyranose mutase
MQPQMSLLCFSHLRWNFVFQRPQHLLTRCARQFANVFYIEEPLFHELPDRLEAVKTDSNVIVLTAHLKTEGGDTNRRVSSLLATYFSNEGISRYVAWYYTPLAIDWFDTSSAAAVVYDCMDELSLFKGAPANLLKKERQLLDRADLVFTGGVSLYHHKRQSHHNVYAFPSSVDFAHFAKARTTLEEPSDQASIPHPRIGFFGVIDERMDLDLLAGVADCKPEFQLVMIGPVVKIDPESLPRRPNIHYLGSKTYAELPQYLSKWDVAMMPFARNESTRFISPTKTPEYLAAGCPVVSTSITDVVSPYGQKKYVRIADIPEDFANACSEALNEDANERRQRIDEFLSQMSWDSTWRSMYELVLSVIELKSQEIADKSGDAAEESHV